MTTVKKKKNLAPLFFTIIIVIFLSIGIYLTIENFKNPAEDPYGSWQSDTVGNVTRGFIESSISGSGLTKAKTKEDLGTDLKGIVNQVYVQTGQSVVAGDLLMSVDPSVLRSELNEVLDEYDVALASVNSINEQIGNLSIKCPFSGKVISCLDQNEGSMVSEGMTYATIVDDTKMKLELFFSYAFIDQIKVGQSATVSIPAATTQVEGTVSAIEAVKKISTSGSMLFKVVIEVENAGTLTSEMTATASIQGENGDIMPAESGLLEYSRVYDIVLKASGELSKKNVNEYYVYNAGDVLGTISNDSLYTELASANRVLESAATSVEEKQLALANTELRATFDGQVSQISVNAGDELTGADGQRPISISNIEELYIDISITEIDITKVEMGMYTSITYEDTDGMQFTDGAISALSLEADTSDNYQGGLTKFPATIKVSNPYTLRPDMNVQYYITASVKENVLLVPVSAVIQTDYGPSLYIKSDNEFSVETFDIIDESIPTGYTVYPVEIGISDGYMSEIIANDEIENLEIYIPYNATFSQGSNMGYGGYYG